MFKDSTMKNKHLLIFHGFPASPYFTLLHLSRFQLPSWFQMPDWCLLLCLPPQDSHAEGPSSESEPQSELDGSGQVFSRASFFGVGGTKP